MKGIGRQHGKVTFCDFLRRPVLIHCQLPCFLVNGGFMGIFKKSLWERKFTVCPIYSGLERMVYRRNGGRFHMIVKEDAGNLIRAVALDG